MKQNLHTHSIFCDGKDTIEEMTLEAISKGFDILGFSGHGYLDVASNFHATHDFGKWGTMGMGYDFSYSEGVDKIDYE